MQSKEGSDALFLYAQEGILLANEKGEITRINPSAEKMFGYEKDELVGKSIEVLIPGRFNKGHQSQRAKYMENPYARHMGKGKDLFGVRKDGKQFPVEISLSPFTKPEGKFVIAFIIDATLLRHTKELEAINNELDQFAYIVSHDLKAPLRGINHLTTWIEEDLKGKLEGETKEHFEMLRKRVRRMENLIDGILAYSRAGRIKGDQSMVNLTVTLNELIEAMAPPPGIKISLPENPPTIHTEKIALEQVLSNMISNAIKYNTSPDPEINISCSDRGDLLEFCVSDNGSGIEKQHHDKIWGMFQVLHSRDSFESTGVGLPIAKKIVEEKNGKVWLVSDKGQGAAFYFTWPKKGYEE